MCILRMPNESPFVHSQKILPAWGVRNGRIRRWLDVVTEYFILENGNEDSVPGDVSSWFYQPRMHLQESAVVLYMLERYDLLYGTFILPANFFNCNFSTVGYSLIGCAFLFRAFSPLLPSFLCCPLPSSASLLFWTFLFPISDVLPAPAQPILTLSLVSFAEFSRNACIDAFSRFVEKASVMIEITRRNPSLRLICY